MAGRGTVFLVSSVHWHFTWQRHHEIATRLASAGFEVVYLEPIPKRWPGPRELGRIWGRLTGRRERAGGVSQTEPENVTLLSPLMLPDTNAMTRLVNRWLVRRLVRQLLDRFPDRPRVVLHYLPLAASIALQHELAPDLAVYDCVHSWPDDPHADQSTLREDDLVAGVDIVLADALYQLDRMRRRSDRVAHVPPAVDYDDWELARATPPPRQDPLCAYFGTIGASIDVDLVRSISRRFPLRLIGPIQVALEGLGPRTEVVGPVARERLPELLADVDVLVLPYGRAPHVRGVLPAKTFECLATGRPVVATRISGLEPHGDIISICDTQESFLAEIEAVFEEPPDRREARLKVARENTWTIRINQVVSVFEEALAEKASRG